MGLNPAQLEHRRNLLLLKELERSRVYMYRSTPKLASKKGPLLGKFIIFMGSRSTSANHRGVLARGLSSLISSRKRLVVVKGGFFRQIDRLTGSSSLNGTLDRTMFAFDLGAKLKVLNCLKMNAKCLKLLMLS